MPGMPREKGSKEAKASVNSMVIRVARAKAAKAAAKEEKGARMEERTWAPSGAVMILVPLLCVVFVRVTLSRV